MKKILVTVLFAGFLALAGISPASATTIHFDVTTSPLTALPGPFYLDFQFLGTANNTLTIDNFHFGAGGSPVAPAVPIGNVTGDLSSSVVMKTDVFFNEFYQQFVPGNLLSFDVSFTNFVLSPPPPDTTPDGFSFAILDNTLVEIPTNGQSNKLSILSINSRFSSSDIQTFSSTDPLGVTVTATPVPEPAALVLVAVGLVGFGARRFRRPRQ